MFSSQSAEISLNAPCRAMGAVRADRTESRFLIGSADPADNNLYVVRFHSEVNELGIDATVPHNTGPVQAIACSPTDPTLAVTASEGSAEATLWKIPQSIMTVTDDMQYDPEESGAMDVASSVVMEEVFTFDPSSTVSPMVDIAWRDTGLDEMGTGGDVVTLNQNGQLTQWDVETGTASRTAHTHSRFVAGLQPRCAWDHHTQDAIAVTVGTRVNILDWRTDTSIPTGTVESFSSHRYGVTDLDYNPNKPYVLATSGQDGLVQFWDLRSAKRPLLVARGGHSHWVSNVNYNPFHDQLVLSSGTDAVANLWRLSTISSAPLLTLNDGDEEASDSAAPNVRVARHELPDSIYAASWSAADAWVYLIVGYDGKAVLNHVPSKEKYKILL